MDNDEDYKSLLIRNDSSDAILTLYVYPHWFCWISKESKIIYPSDRYLYRSKKKFQFEVVARFDDRKDKKSEDDSQTDKKDEEDKQDKPKKKKQVLREVQQWKEDKLMKITGFFGSESLDVVEGDLTHYPEDKQICLRRLQRNKELKFTSGERNRYEILGLDMAKVRKMSNEEQKQVIRRGYHKQMRLWHPDNNDRGDEEIVKEIIKAYEVLEDKAERARYNNQADYDGGWLSWSRYKAILKPECVNEQEKAYRKRMCMFAASVAMTAIGIGLTVGTAGLAAPALVAVGAVLGGGLIGGGFQSLQHTLNQRAIVDECLVKEWLMKAGIGFLGGAATGGAAAGFTAAITGLGSAALESAAITAGQYMGVGAATGATGGVAASIALDAGRKFVDGKQITWKQVVGHAVVGGVIGAATGIAGGAVTKAIVAGQASAASANLQGEIAEQAAIVTGAKRVGNVLAKNIPRMLTEKGAEAMMGTVFRLAEERLDDSVENRSPCDHVVDGIKNVAANTVMGVARECTAAGVSHVWNEVTVDRELKTELQNPPSTEAMSKTDEVTQSTEHESRGPIRFKMDTENNEHLHKMKDGVCSAKYQPLLNENTSELTRESKKKRDLPEEKKVESNCHRTSKWPSGYQPIKNEETFSQSLPLCAPLESAAITAGQYMGVGTATGATGGEAVMGTVSRFAEERLEDSVENRSPCDHVVDGIKNVAANTVMGVARECTAAGVSHVWNEVTVDRELKTELQNPPSTEAMSKTDEVTQSTEHESRGPIRFKMDTENNEHLHKMKDGVCSAKYQPLLNENTSELTRESKKKRDLPEEKKEESNCHRTSKWSSGYQPLKNEETSSQSLPSDPNDYGEENASTIILEEANGKVKYISKGAWYSKMVVSFVLNEKKIVKEARGSGSSVDIPSVARNIEVKFQVKRPFWGDVCKYDRFLGRWYKPDQPHVFCYDSPPIHRTFTISGGLWYEAVMRVSNEYHEETKEM